MKDSENAMTETTKRDEREAFEAWWKTQGYGDDIMRQINWQAWQSRAALATAPEQAAAGDEVPVEIWHGERKVTIYADSVLRSWGPNIEADMSDAPRTLQAVQDAVDWLYVAPPPASTNRLTDEQIEALRIAADALIERYAAPIRAIVAAREGK